MKKVKAIELIKVSKKYSIRHEKPTFLEQLFSKKRLEEFWALKKISLVINKGERVGIIGLNGSGKTTLLRLMAGVIESTEGQVITNGRLVSLIELGAGFHPDMTGEENIFLNALILGMSRKKVKQKFKKIVNWADIGKFIDAPVYTYSDGMKLRLGFSVLIHTNPEIILLDEGLALGDQDFKKKFTQKFNEWIKSKKTIVMAGHNLSQLSSMCERVIWLEKGRVKMVGQPKKVINKYAEKVLRSR